MLQRNRLADFRKNVFFIPSAKTPFDLLNQDQLFVPILADHKSAAAVGPQKRMRLLRRRLNILRVEIYAANDNQVLNAAGHVEFAVGKEAEVPGPHERPFPGVGQIGVKRFVGLDRLAPVSEGDTR